MPSSTTSLRDLHQLHQRAKALRDRLTSGPKTLAARKLALEARQKALEDARKSLQDEKLAVKKLNAGENYYSEVADKDGQPVLRAATRVPVVMKQCLACHPGFKEGDLIGALVYEVPIK